MMLRAVICLAVLITLTFPGTAHATAPIVQSTSTGSGTGTMTVARPAGTTAGDLLVAEVYVVTTGGIPIMMAPAGWNSAGSYTISGPKLYTYYKWATASEPASYTFAELCPFCVGSDAHGGGIFRISGANTTTPFDGSLVALGQLGVTQGVAPSRSTSVNDVLLLGMFAGEQDSGGATHPAGYTGRWIITAPSAPAPTGTKTITAASRVQVTAGVTGSAATQFGTPPDWATGATLAVLGPDETPPSSPAPVLDGTGADQAWSNDALHVSANWQAVTDLGGSGMKEFRVCVSATIASGTCTGTPNLASTSVGLATAITAMSVTTPLSEGVTYHVCVSAEDNAGNASRTCSDGFTVDSLAPTPDPLPAQATAVSTTSIDWLIGPAPVVDPAGGIGLHAAPYSIDSGTASWQASTARTEISLAPNTQYTRTLRARDALDNTRTTTLSRYTLAGAPTALAATSAWNPTDGYVVNLTWTAPIPGGAAGYEIRSSADGYAAAVGSVVGTTGSVPALTAATTYTFRICSINDDGVVSPLAGCSGPITQLTPLAGPVSQSAAPVDASTLRMTWTAVPGAGQYRVELFSDNSCSTAVTNDTTAATTLDLTGLDADHRYWYRIRSYDAGIAAWGGPSTCTSVATAVQLALDASTLDFGVTLPQVPIDRVSTLSITGYESSGYTVMLQSDGPFRDGSGHSIPATTSGSVGTLGDGAGPWTGDGFGFSLDAGAGVGANWGAGTRFAAVTTAPQAIVDTGHIFTPGAPRVTTLATRYRLSVPTGAVPGSYHAALTYTVIALP